MWFVYIIKLFLRLFFLRAQPEQIPYSKVLLSFLAILIFALKNIINLWFIDIIKVYDKQHVINLSLPSSAIIAAVYLLILVACVRTVLSYYDKTERSVQVISAFLGVDLLLALLFLVWMFLLSQIQLPLQAGSASGLLLILFFIVILYWQFMVYIHIIYSSLETTVLRSGIYALVYMLLQHNVTEILMDVFLTEDSVAR